MAVQTTITDRYQVERSIGRGGMGTVWLARDERLGRHVAVKQIGLLPGETAPDLARAMREARSSAVLHHPHVVSVYDVVEEDDHIWLVMEYVASRTLWEVISQDGPLTPEAAVSIGAQIADGLAAAHAAGTIHRDVKPGNILVTADQVAKISDFGIARAHDQGQLTQTGLVIGTPEYFAPELARGEDPTPAVDVWALGATLYAAVEGHPPYPHQSNALALLMTIASTPPPRAEHAGFLTEPIARMLDPDPASRWSMQDATHVLKRLQEAHAREHTRQSTATTPAEPALDEPDDRPQGESRRPRGGRLMLAGLIGLLALVALGGFLLLHHGSADQPSASDRSHTRSAKDAPRKGSTPKASDSASTTPSSPTTATGGDRHPAGQGVRGADARTFVRSYYAALPSDTRSAWSALSPGFQSEIGGYDSYRGFWSTISSVSVGRTAPAGDRAVDVSLTYTKSNGQVDREVRRLYLERTGSGYLITGDDVVG
jgi:serine/threonine protein kinase